MSSTPQEKGLLTLQAFAEKVMAISELYGRRNAAKSTLGRHASETHPKVIALKQVLADIDRTEADLNRMFPEVQRLALAVGVDFGRTAPTNDYILHAVNRPIGEYERWVKTGAKPEPPARSKSDAEGARVRQIPWWGTLLIAVVSGGGAGWGASFLTTFYGPKQTCIAGREMQCTPRDVGPGLSNIPHVQTCNDDGRGFGPCEPASVPPSAKTD